MENRQSHGLAEESVMSTKEEWPGPNWTDEAKARLVRDYTALSVQPTERLMLLALASILQEQYRTADRSPGWPPLRDRALERALLDRAGVLS